VAATRSSLVVAGERCAIAQQKSLPQGFLVMELSKSKSRVLEMFSLAIADGFVSPGELALIYSRGADLGLGRDQIDEIIQHPDGVAFVAPESLVETILRLYDLGAVVVSDDAVDAREVDLLKSFARKFSIREDLVDSIVGAVVEEVKAGTSHDELVETLSREMSL
jgi:hypothetical protein